MLGAVKRVEDPRLLRGQGRYVGDLQLPGQLEVAFVRSPHAHARVRDIEAQRALEQPGVVAVLTGAEAARESRPMRPRLGVPGFKACEQPCLAVDKVRFVGQAVAAVVAESRYLAEDALDFVEVDYEPLPAVVDARQAVEPGAPLLFEAWGDNVHVESAFSAGDPEAAFA
jgi:carbon-monoxide dehydrogenase large subunit